MSVPLLAPDMTGTTLFPTATSPFYSFTNNYNQVIILENSKGYWAKFNGNQSQTISGTPVNSNQISVVQGWNLIGIYDSDIPTISITSSPPNIISSPFYGYEVGYVISDTLKVGKGFWVKTNADGIIELNNVSK